MSEQAPAPQVGETARTMVVRLVREAWDVKQQGVLLSRLGFELARRPEVTNAELRRRKLAVFIEQDLKDEIQLLTSPSNPIVRVALPRNVDIDLTDPTKYFPQGNPLQRAARSSGVQNAIVVAFSRPLAAGMKRVITLSPAVRFDDIPEAHDVPDQAKVVERRWIVEDGQLADDERTNRILSNVAAWREAADLAPQAIASKDKVEDRGLGSVLELLLSALSESDQKRIQLPLDIVGRLLARRAK